ncbi:hypothetical protein PLICRDRAFT_114870, partial [Plicaturopsis crispa FD-325 SS-3]
MPQQSGQRTWSVKEIRDLVEKKFHKRPCWLQIKIALALYEGQKDVVGTAATGAGKTLSFWIPLLMALEDGQDKMIIVVTPLNILGEQNVKDLEAAGLNAIAVNSENANAETFKDIESGKYRVVVVNPEILMNDGGQFENLWKKKSFTSRLLYFVFDEGHCVSKWGSFRKEYLYLGSLRHLIPEIIPFYVASATLPAPVLLDVSEILRLRPDHTEHILRTNDRPNVHIMVRGLKFAANSFADLAFLIPDHFQDGDPPPEKFLIFFDNIKETEAAVRYLRSRLPRNLHNKIKWFHSVMTQDYRTDEYESLRAGDLWGLCVTDAFGMGLDLPDIRIVIQWKATCDLCSLWQRFGRAARGLGQEAIAIFFVEKKYFDEERKKKVA